MPDTLEDILASVGMTPKADPETEFQSWYADRSAKLGLDPNPDAPEHFYDYRAAHRAGAEPDQTGHWPSTFKRSGHPRQFLPIGHDGAMVDTITGEEQDSLDAILSDLHGKPSGTRLTDTAMPLAAVPAGAETANAYQPSLAEQASESLRNAGLGFTAGAKDYARGAVNAIASPLGMPMPAEPVNENAIANPQGASGDLGAQVAHFLPWMLGAGGVAGAAGSTFGSEHEQSIAAGDPGYEAWAKALGHAGMALAVPKALEGLAAPVVGTGLSRLGAEVAPALDNLGMRTAAASVHGGITGAGLAAGNAAVSVATGDLDRAQQEILNLPHDALVMAAVGAGVHLLGEGDSALGQNMRERNLNEFKAQLIRNRAQQIAVARAHGESTPEFNLEHPWGVRDAAIDVSDPRPDDLGGLAEQFANDQTRTDLQPVGVDPSRTVARGPNGELVDVGMDRYQPAMPGPVQPVTAGPGGIQLSPEDITAALGRLGASQALPPIDPNASATGIAPVVPGEAPVDAGTQTAVQAQEHAQQLQSMSDMFNRLINGENEPAAPSVTPASTPLGKPEESPTQLARRLLANGHDRGTVANAVRTHFKVGHDTATRVVDMVAPPGSIKPEPAPEVPPQEAEIKREPQPVNPGPPARGPEAAPGVPTTAPAPVREPVAPQAPQVPPGNAKPVKSGVKGWQAFPPESGTLGIPRAEMPQVKSEHRGALANYLRARGIEFERTEATPASLHPSQAEFHPKKVDKARTFTGEQRAILVSSDNYVVDGHHQYQAAMDHPDKPIPVIRLQAPIKDVLPAVREFPSSEQAAGATTPPQGVTHGQDTQAPQAVPVQVEGQGSAPSEAAVQGNAPSKEPGAGQAGGGRDLQGGAERAQENVPPGGDGRGPSSQQEALTPPKAPEAPSLADVVGRQEPLQVPPPLERSAEPGKMPRSKDPAIKNQKSLSFERQPDVIDAINEIGGIRSKPKDYAGGEYDDKANYPVAYRIMRKGAGSLPDQAASELQRQGIGDGTTNTMWKLIDQAITARATASAGIQERPAPGDTTMERQAIQDVENGQEEEKAGTGNFRILGHGPGGSTIGKHIWGEKSLVKNDVVPTVREAAKGIKEAHADLQAMFAPQTGGEQAKLMAGMAREHGAEMALRSDRATEALRTARRMMDAQSLEENLTFIDRMESGQPQPSGPLELIARTMREILDQKRGEIQALGTGKLDHFIEDYFPHIWKDPEQAASVFGQAVGKRPLEGGKTFLKKRTIPTVAEGIKAGLELASPNPVDLVLLKAREMDKYLLGQRLLTEMKAKGLAKYVRATETAPDGLTAIDDRIATVYGKPTVTVTEHVDKAVLKPLREVLNNLGIAHGRKTSAGRGRLGYSVQGGKEIVTKFGSELGVVAHELGHQLDAIFNLGEKLNKPDVEDELKALADLHGHQPAYFNKPEERTASVLEAYVQARDRMRDLAPKTLVRLEHFIEQHPELAPLSDIRPSLEYQKLTAEQPHGGLLKMGTYYAPDAAAKVINNYLSPGLRGKSGIFRGYLGVANFLNQVQLGLSAFHLGFTSLDAATSRFAVGIEHLVDGNLGKATAAIASTPLAPFTNVVRGNKVLREWYKPGSQGAEMAQLIDAMRAAGGRAKMDSFLTTNAADRMLQAFRSGNILGGILRLPAGTLDLAAKPIMDYLVPRQKLGIFADMARRELDNLPPDATRDQVREVLGKAWDSVDNRMGQLVYDNLFWHKTAKDLAMASVRSLGWNIGTFREIGGGLVDSVRAAKQAVTGKRPRMTSRMAYLVALPVVVGTLGAMINYLLTGKHPEELKDYFYPKTGKKNDKGEDMRLALPSYMKDVYGFSHAPGTTLLNKMHPLIGTAGEMLANKDYYGTEIRHVDDPLVKQALEVATYLTKQAVPFGIRNAMQGAKDHTGTVEKVAGFFGITKAPYWLDQTAAMQKASELLKEKMPQGSRTQAEADKAQNARDIASGLRSPDAQVKQQAHDTLTSGVKDGSITRRQAHAITVRAVTPGLVHDVSHLDAEDAMQVWRVATPQERVQLKPVMQAKIARSTITPAEKRVLIKELMQTK